jgi:hypothetical protein
MAKGRDGGGALHAERRPQPMAAKAIGLSLIMAVPF